MALPWIETKNTFYNLNRMGVTEVRIPLRKYYELQDMIAENTDDGGSHNQHMVYDRKLLTFYGIRVEIEDV